MFSQFMTPKYVAKNWYVNTQPNQNGNYIEIEARPGGMMAWILEKLGIDPTTEVYVDDQNFILEKGSLAGNVREVVPLRKISATNYGYTKPLVQAAVMIALIITIPVAVYKLIYDKTLQLGVKASGGVNSEIRLKTKRLTGEEITEQEAQQFSYVIQQLVDNSTSDGPTGMLGQGSQQQGRQQQGSGQRQIPHNQAAQ